MTETNSAVNIAATTDVTGENDNYKTFPLCGGAKTLLNLNDGSTVTAFPTCPSAEFAVPLGITHSYVYNNPDSNFGRSWRLSLQKKLVETDGLPKQFVYTDELGKTHVLKEIFYYVQNNKKVTVDKTAVETDINGNLFCTVGGRKTEVKKLQKYGDYTLITEIKGVKNAELLQQKPEEYAELENYVNAYEPTLKNYVAVNSANGEIIKRMTAFDKPAFEELIKDITPSSDGILLPESEALQLRSLYYAVGLEDIKELQAQIYQSQIEYIIKQAKDNFYTVKATFISCFAKKAQITNYKKHMPVNYIKDSGGLINGFNAEGDLVCIFDNFGNSVALEYDASGKIIAAHDSNGKFLCFDYENDKLSCITDSLGRKTKFEYLGGVYLDKVTYPDGSFLKLGYGTIYLCSVTTETGARGEQYYDNLMRRLERIENYVADETVSINSQDIFGGAAESGTQSGILISKYVFKYGDPREKDEDYTSVMGTNPEDEGYFTKISYLDGSFETYMFNDSHKIQSVISANAYNRTKNITYEYGTDESGYDYEKETVNDTEEGKQTYTVRAYDGNGYPVYEETGGEKVSSNCTLKVRTEYFYDVDDRPVKQLYIKIFNLNGAETKRTEYVNYVYGANGALALTESGVEGEESTSGINYEKRVYDKNGNVIKTVKWNSLDSSTKFYSESVTGENGLVTAEKDGAGEVCAEYEYVEGTNVVNSVKYPCGGNVSYGRNPYNFNVTSVTASTEEGEGNTTDIIYKRGLPVEVKSGNTVINYEYDGKGRKTAVYVNGNKQEEYYFTDFNADDYQTQYTFGGSKTKIYVSDYETIVAESTANQVMGDMGGVDKLETVTVNDSVIMTRRYNLNGRIQKIEDKVTGENIAYDFTEQNKLRSINRNSGKVSFYETYEYDNHGRIRTKRYIGTVQQVCYYNYKNSVSEDISYYTNGNNKIYPLCDKYGRNIGKEIKVGANKIGEYVTYRKTGDRATNMPATLWYADKNGIKDSIKYTYDKRGNISEVRENGHLTAKYTYDNLNRLVREDNKPFNKTVLFTYDTNGNIIERCEYAYSLKSAEELSETECTHFSYDYDGDKLIGYNGEVCAYNNLGSPTTYRGKSATWKYGKLLASYDGNTFEYDCLGNRSAKNGIGYAYDCNGNIVYSTNGITFIYAGK